MADPRDGGNGGNGGADYDPLQVNLPIFDGPLDLLLHLVAKQSLDIKEVRLSELTEPYLAYLEGMEELNLDVAGEFLSIAAKLIWIKSKSLLPKSQQEDDPDPEDLEEILLLRLQEYKKVKEAADELMQMDMLGRDIFPRHEGPEEGEAGAEQPEPVFEEISLYGLIEAFRKVLERSKTEKALHLVPERNRVEDKLGEMLELLAQRKSMHFHELFLQDSDRAEIILAFIALLELVRLKAIKVIQAGNGEILCEITEAFTKDGRDWRELIMGSLYSSEKAAAEEEAPPGLLS